MQKRTVIFFEQAGNKRYVSEHSVRPDESIVPIYTTKLDEARTYNSEEDAKEKIGRFVNLNNREFKTDQVAVGSSRRIRFDFQLEDELS